MSVNGYPAMEKALIFDIGVADVEQHYPAPGRMHCRARAGNEETVATEVKQIAADVFLVSWQEADGITVVHVENFSAMTFDCCVTMPDGRFRRFTSSMRWAS
jgi:hypothetical protein